MNTFIAMLLALIVWDGIKLSFEFVLFARRRLKEMKQ
jgi:hypothetical protein